MVKLTSQSFSKEVESNSIIHRLGGVPFSSWFGHVLEMKKNEQRWLWGIRLSGGDLYINICVCVRRGLEVVK